jgi:hypothetical protein
MSLALQSAIHTAEIQLTVLYISSASYATPNGASSSVSQYYQSLGSRAADTWFDEGS